jgi:hypothetical protein
MNADAMFLRRTFPGDSEMAHRMRSLDWMATPLGRRGSGPSPLKLAVALCLTSRYPIVLENYVTQPVLLQNIRKKPLQRTANNSDLAMHCEAGDRLCGRLARRRFMTCNAHCAAATVVNGSGGFHVHRASARAPHP